MISKQSWSDVAVEKSGHEGRGARSQACRANGQRKNKCIAVSGSAQCEQAPLVSIPRVWRLVPKARAPRHSFHKKSLSFGDVDTLHTSFC